MITKEKLNELNEKVNEMKAILKGQEGDEVIDIFKSLIILESKIKHYSSYYDALKSLKKIKSGEAEK